MRTYVVRIHESRDDEGDALRGVAEEIATGRRMRFASSTQLLKALKSTITRTGEGDGGSQGDHR